MTDSRALAGLTRQVLAAWTVVLSVLLAWTVGSATPQASAGLSLRAAAISAAGTPELALVQVKTAPVLRGTDERYGAGSDPALPVHDTTTRFAAGAITLWPVAAQDCPAARPQGPHCPRAPPAI